MASMWIAALSILLGAIKPHGGARLRLGGCDRNPGLYVVDIHPILADEFVRRGAIPGGLTWHFAHPPLQGLDFEARGVAHELVI
jgi:hypothetical protein